MRVMQNPENLPFVQFLLQLGEGSLPTVQMGTTSDYVRIPDEFIFHPTNPTILNSPIKQLIKAMYPTVETARPRPEDIVKCAILTTLNSEVNKINNIATEMLFGGEATTYLAQDSVADDDNFAQFSVEYLNSLEPSGLPPYKLLLKVGQPVMLLRNMNPKRGLCNGTRLIVCRLTARCIEAEIIVGKFLGKKVFIPRIPLITSDDGTTPVKFKRTQFPVRPAFAMTINKSQGQTLQQVAVYLPQPVFSHGQLYVALSRCSNPENLKILIYNGSIPSVPGVFTRNIVFTRVLRNM